MQFANQILSGYGTTIFTVMSALAQEHGAVNLGQGFPDWEGPEEVRRVAADGSDMLTQVEADMEFHRLLCHGSENPRFLTVFEQIATETELSIMLIGRLYDDAHRLAETHVPILEALRGGDEAEAVEALRFHIDVARVLVTQQFRDLEDGPSE